MYIVFVLLLAIAKCLDASPEAPALTGKEAPAVTLKEIKPRNHRDKEKARRQQLRERKKTAAEQKPTDRKTLRTMTYKELKNSKDSLLQAGDKSSACKYLEKMLPLANDLEDRRDVMLELAETYFDTGDLEKAGKMYNEFTTMYPSSKAAEMASYKAILCSFYATLDSERDQTKTQDTIELALAFLERGPVFDTYAKEVKDILKQCRTKLFDNEAGIFNFYVNRGMFTSANTRLELIRKTIAPQLPDAEPRLLVLECSLAERQNNPTLLAQKQAELVQKFPEFTQTLVQAKPKSFLNRF